MRSLVQVSESLGRSRVLTGSELSDRWAEREPGRERFAGTTDDGEVEAAAGV